MSDYKGDLQKIRQMSQFEMRHSYDSNKTEDKKKMGEFNYYNKAEALEENAAIERVLNLQSTGQMTEQLPEVAMQEMKERLFANKAYLLVNEHSKSDSPYMDAVKTSVAALTEALYAPIEKGKVGAALDDISTKYQTALDNCKNYLERGTGKKKPPFWPWHRARFDAVDDMATRLADEKEKFENRKAYVFRAMDEDSLGMKQRAGESAQNYYNYRSVKFENEGNFLIHSAMDVILMDKFTEKNQTEYAIYVRNEESVIFKGQNKTSVSTVQDEIKESDQVIIPEQYDLKKTLTILDNPSGDLTEEDTKTLQKGSDFADKVLESDAGAIVACINDLTKENSEAIIQGSETQNLQDAIKQLESVVKPAKKTKKTLDISPEICYMGEVLLDQLKQLLTKPERILSQLPDADLELILNQDILFDDYTSFMYRERSIKKMIPKVHNLTNKDLFFILTRINGGRMADTYDKYVIKMNLVENAKEVQDKMTPIHQKTFRNNLQNNFG